MTKRTFTADDNGERFELMGSDLPLTNGYIIKPIPKAVEKRYWSLWFQPDGVDSAPLFSEKLTEPQAQAYAAAIEALIAEIMTDGKDSSRDYGGETGDAVAVARAALQKEGA